MFRSFAYLAVAGVLATIPQQQPVFHGGEEAVRVFTTVTDHDGRLVTTLTRDDFEVRDDGKPQPLTVFDNTPQPIRIIVLLDVSGSMAGNLPLLRAASQQLFARLRPDDLARLGTFGKDVTIGPEFTRDTGELLGILPERIPPEAPTPLWRAVDQAIASVGGNHAAVTERDAAASRPVILVMTDGKDSGPTDFRHNPSSQADVIDHARGADVMIYAVGMRSRPAPGQRAVMPGFGAAGLQAALTADLPDPGLARVAEETGGGYTEIRYGEDLGAAFERVADELHSQYLLGYAPPKHDGRIHKVEVRVTTKGLKTRARKSYVAPKS
ncbi:MAG TPA: VWA domain-containing protein [Vicinamibacterales bacterium]|jgi:Ca-activated chloride channel family protein